MKGAVIDLDGTVYRSTELIPGALDGIATLRDAGVDLAFVSNTSTKSRATCRDRLQHLGIEAALKDVVTSASVTAQYVAKAYPGATVFAIGQPTLLEELTRAGVTLTDDPDAAEVVVVGKDRSFTFETLGDVLDALDEEVPFVVTNMDRTAPTSDGVEPGTGAVVGAIVAATEREPDVIAGKPHEPTIDVTLDLLGHHPSECLVIGDNPDSDVAMGTRAGMKTVLVLTGVADAEDARTSDADYVLESMADIGDVLAAEGSS